MDHVTDGDARSDLDVGSSTEAGAAAAVIDLPEVPEPRSEAAGAIAGRGAGIESVAPADPADPADPVGEVGEVGPVAVDEPVGESEAAVEPASMGPGGSDVDTSPVLAAYVVIAMFWAAVGVLVGALVW